jgi:hypothetical protein
MLLRVEQLIFTRVLIGRASFVAPCAASGGSENLRWFFDLPDNRGFQTASDHYKPVTISGSSIAFEVDKRRVDHGCNHQPHNRDAEYGIRKKGAHDDPDNYQGQRDSEKTAHLRASGILTGG